MFTLVYVDQNLRALNNVATDRPAAPSNYGSYISLNIVSGELIATNSEDRGRASSLAIMPELHSSLVCWCQQTLVVMVGPELFTPEGSIE